MKYCQTCGKQLVDDAVFCPGCGCAVGNNAPAGHNNAGPAADAPNIGFAILSFFFPLIGLILWLVWKDTYPLKAKSCGKGALIGVIVGVVIGIIAGIIVAVTVNNVVNQVTNPFGYYGW